MIYRTLIDSAGVIVSVEDETGVLFVVPVESRAAATALIKRAVKNGYETIRPDEKKKSAK